MSRRIRRNNLKNIVQQKARQTFQNTDSFPEPRFEYQGRKYPDGQPTDPNLPTAYGLPPQDVENQACHNCKFYNNNYCTFWNAPVRHEYWCAKWKSIYYTARPSIEQGDSVREVKSGRVGNVISIVRNQVSWVDNQTGKILTSHLIDLHKLN